MSEVIHRDSIERWAYEQVTGADAGLTAECLGDFVQCMGAQRTPAKAPSLYMTKPVSDFELIRLMFDRRAPDSVLAAATRELAARYLDSDATKAIVQKLVERTGE